MRPDLPSAVPEIPVSDVDKAIAYYRTAFGFALDWHEKEIGLAGVSRGDCRLFLANTDFRKGRGNVGPMLIWLNVDSKVEVDELYRGWSENEAIMDSSPESKPWGLHEFTASDPDGNIFRVFYDFATPEREKTTNLKFPHG